MRFVLLLVETVQPSAACALRKRRLVPAHAAKTRPPSVVVEPSTGTTADVDGFARGADVLVRGRVVGLVDVGGSVETGGVLGGGVTGGSLGPGRTTVVASGRETTGTSPSRATSWPTREIASQATLEPAATTIAQTSVYAAQRPRIRLTFSGSA